MCVCACVCVYVCVCVLWWNGQAELALEVFTTRPELLTQTTYLTIGPGHPAAAAVAHYAPDCEAARLVRAWDRASAEGPGADDSSPGTPHEDVRTRTRARD
jgi:hypothetical protein